MEKGDKMKKNEERNLLLIKLSSLGDILLATPAIRELKIRNMNSKIYMLVNKNCYSVVKDNKYIDEIIIADNIGETKNLFLEGIKILKVIIKIFSIGFDEAYILHRNKILMYMCLLGRIKNIKIFGDKSFRKKNVEYIEFNLSEHRIYRNLRVIVNDNYENCKTNMEYFSSDNSQVIEKYKLKENKYVVFSPGGGKNAWSEMKSRRWDKESYKEVIKRLAINYNIILIGGKDDINLCNELTINEKVISYAGKTSIEETAMIIKNGILFIGNDSMPLFMAGAVGIPLIGLFGPTNGEVINPIGEKFDFIQANVSCSPCYNPLNGINDIAYTCDHISCMKKGIAAEEVIKKAEKLLI